MSKRKRSAHAPKRELWVAWLDDDQVRARGVSEESPESAVQLVRDLIAKYRLTMPAGKAICWERFEAVGEEGRAES